MRLNEKRAAFVALGAYECYRQPKQSLYGHLRGSVELDEMRRLNAPASRLSYLTFVNIRNLRSGFYSFYTLLVYFDPCLLNIIRSSNAYQRVNCLFTELIPMSDNDIMIFHTRNVIADC
jgi:hypothetical protein